MADASYWANLMNSPQGEALRMQGAAALESGAVTEEEARAAISPLLKFAGINKGKKNAVLSTLAKKRAPANPSVGAGMELPELPAMPQVARGSGMSNESQVKAQDSAASTTSNKDVAQAFQFMTPDQLDSLYTSTSNLPAFREQAEGIKTAKDMLAIAAQAQPDIYSGPLSGLLQAEFGRNVGTMAGMRGPTPEQQRNNILSMSGKIQDDQRDLSKNIFDAIGKQRAGYTMTTVADQLALKSILDQMRGQQNEDPKKFEKAGRAGPNLILEVEKHQKRMEGLEGTRTTLQELDDLLGGIDRWDGKSDIPGVGLTGRLGSSLLSSKGSEIQRAYTDLKNQIVNMRSGKQINEAEARRLSVALGSGLTAGDREFMSGLKAFRRELQNIMKQKEAAVKGTSIGPEVLRQYKAGGGTLSEEAIAPSAKPLSFEEWKKAGKPKAGK